MADIFISYSSKDREKAQQLTELLASAGLSVWIDKQGIGAATSWSEEIVDGIDNCKMFIVMLSPYSIESHNVVKEVSLASEKRKKILPLDLEPVEIPKNLQYALAGLQRTPMTNIDAIIRAIGKLGLEATQAPTMKLVKESDGRKSLMILPFEDLSPTGDNGWFADGIVSELIGALSNIGSLRIADNQATKEFKNYHGQLSAYAQAMSIRYFVQGDVRKFGDQIKVSSRLLDIETGDYLWQDSLKGTMDDIFDIQEKVAEKVVEGLKLHLVGNEAKELTQRGTENAEAYELYLRAEEYFHLNGKEDLEHAAKLAGMAIEADPKFAQAMLRRAIIIAELHVRFHIDTPTLAEAEELLRNAQDHISATQDWRIIGVQAKLARARGDLELAEKLYRKNQELNPDSVNTNQELGNFLGQIGRGREGFEFSGRAFELKPTYEYGHEVVNGALMTEDPEILAKYCAIFLPLLEGKRKVDPENEQAIVWYGLALHFVGRDKEALAFLRTIRDDKLHSVDYLYNGSCLAVLVGENDRAMTWLVRYCKTSTESAAAKLHNICNTELAALRGRPDYDALVKELEEKLPNEQPLTTTNEIHVDRQIVNLG